MGNRKENKKYELDLPVTHINLEKRVNGIPVTKTSDDKIIFSYKFFKCISVKGRDFNNCFSNIYEYSKWITLLLQKITNISSMKLSEARNSSTSLRFHPVDGKPLNVLKETLLNSGTDCNKIFSQDEGENYYELSLGTSNGRIFGYLVGNLYYILLFDPHHLIYPNKAKGSTYDLLHKNYNPWETLL